MTQLFYLSAALMAAVVTLWLIAALRRAPAASAANKRRAANVAVLRDQLRELERDRANGILSQDAFAEARTELQRLALEEAGETQDRAAATNPGRLLPASLALALPLAAIIAYVALGNPAAIAPPQAPVAQPEVTAADIRAMVAKLETRLASNPDDYQGWLMLARSHRYFGRHADAVQSFARAAPVVDSNPAALAEYAESLVLSANRGFGGQPDQLLRRALDLNPEEPLALMLTGASRFDQRDFPAAIDFWQRLLARLPAGSDMARTVNEGITLARQRQREGAAP
ncbi:c-type cytochrome biogenesis protein CcmI [Achromobacter insolitus]|uniref:c-type cytochrome biogenesis protein CcmI n=1 Tax=Achromobacter insolitus TaxID=217204 RepID=UPI0005374A0D|nr:c-type cytochrome biogenesis protein CcmI [Achromobacter insolitus]AVG41432.1 c-type cytochrome biogenesis protein CcmI [Achromobacter insolitus]